ncbi:uncharacterized protein LOC135464913 [Liolophura sinensis]|uniref:uncharacterized protein LOC135464913 n=1 Tax=Liolophura sinensis TaxID=3198878 RepID=UPI003158F5F8
MASTWRPPSKANLLRALVLVVGCLAKFSAGSIFAFNVYSNAIKATFNYTQTEVLLLASMVNLGLGVGLPAGMVFDKFGPILTSIVGLLSTSAGYLLIWSSFKNPTFYSTRNPLMALYFFIIGHGSLYTYMSALGTNVRNFRDKHRAKIIGLLDACFGGSPAIFVLVYSEFYTNGHAEDQQNQNVAGFMLLFAIWFAIANFLCVLFLRIYPPDSENISNNVSKSGTVQAEECEKTVIGASASDAQAYSSFDDNASINADVPDSKGVTNKSSKPSEMKQILLLFLDWKFQYLLWMFIFASVVGLAFVNNVTVVTKSVGLSKIDSVVTALIPVTGILARFTLGPLSDHIKERFARINILLITNVVFAASQFMCIFLADRSWAFILANILSGISIGSLWTFVPAVISEYFGLRDFGRNWGIVILLAALAGIGVQAGYGMIYQSFITDPDTTNCYGLICVKWNFVMMCGLTACAILLNIFLILTTRSEFATAGREHKSKQAT